MMDNFFWLAKTSNKPKSPTTRLVVIPSEGVLVNFSFRVTLLVLHAGEVLPAQCILANGSPLSLVQTLCGKDWSLKLIAHQKNR